MSSGPHQRSKACTDGTATRREPTTRQTLGEEASRRSPCHRVFCVVLLGLLLRVPSDQPGKIRRGKNCIHHPVWSFLLYLHVVWPQKHWSNLQRAIQTCLVDHWGKHVEAYVDDMVIKTENFIEDLQLVFNSLRRYRWKLNPKKCVFGVPTGKLLGFIVSHRGIEANPEKIEVIMRMEAPRSQKKVQRLTGCMAALSRFISRLGEKGLPFYKLLKKVDKFQWTSEAQKALDALKKFLTTSPVLKPPRRATPSQPAEDLLLYISCTTHVVSTVLVVE
jgi:hypothetical protein